MTVPTALPPYAEGLHRLGAVTSTYLQPDGGFGLSNAGVVARGDDTLLVDTFFDLAHTRRLLDAIGRPVRRCVNTHDNGDHCWGNQLLAQEGAELIGHRHCAEDMTKISPAVLGALLRMPPDTVLGRYFAGAGDRFDFDGIEVTPPTTVFDDELTLDVEGVAVHLVHVGPAHTRSDVIAHVPADGVVFCGDILFRLCTPLGWEGDTDTWIAALELIATLDAGTLVPGHGPVCTPAAALEMRDYFEYVRAEARSAYERGVTLADAAASIDPGPYAAWAESERVVSIVARNYREFGAGDGVDPVTMLTWMAQRWEADSHPRDGAD
ncbi:MAG: MBL fold metallo-hydrolase [Acidimicrobiia bacterium]|nr:MBL fold metallo-hydrolase [Acidimicrobiia bacterium]